MILTASKCYAVGLKIAHMLLAVAEADKTGTSRFVTLVATWLRVEAHKKNQTPYHIDIWDYAQG